MRRWWANLEYGILGRQLSLLLTMIEVVILIGRSLSAKQSNKPSPERHGALNF
jgi:hypothetical protein